MTAPTGRPTQARRAAAPGAWPQRHPRAVGGHQTHCGGGHRGAADVLSGWVPIGLVAVLVLMIAWLARIPRGAPPSIPRWLWVLLILGAVTATFAGGSPIIALGSVEVGSAVCSTSCGSPRCRSCCSGSAPWCRDHQCRRSCARHRHIGPPAAPLRVPIDDWAVAVALALRAFPMLIDEFRVLYAARRLRPKQRPPTRRGRHRQWWAVSSICSPRRSRWRCGEPTRWATRSPRGAEPVRSLRRPPSRNGVTGWHFRWSPSSVASRSRWNSPCWEPANRDSAPTSRCRRSSRLRDINSPTRR